MRSRNDADSGPGSKPRVMPPPREIGGWHPRGLNQYSPGQQACTACRRTALHGSPERPVTTVLEDLRAEVYERRREAARLRELVFTGPVPAGSVAALAAAEQALVEAERRRSEAERGVADRAGILAVERVSDVLGEETTGLVATLSVRMAQVPLSI